MKYLKSFNEDITNIEDESYILKQKFIDKYVRGVCDVDNLGKYSVDGDVIINNYKNSTLPIEFSNVSGSFHITSCDIYDLTECPNYVGGDFYIFKCEYINSLKGCPTHVGGEFYLANNDFTKIDYLPNYVGGDIDIHGNGVNKITTNFPGYIGGDSINLNNNKLVEVDFDIFNLSKNNINNLFLKNNKITKLKNVPSDVEIYLDGNDLPEQLQTYIDVDIINYDPKVINMLGDYSIWNSDGSLNIPRYSLFLKDNNIR